MTGPTSSRVIVGASSQDYPGWVRTQEDQLDITRRDDWTAMFTPGTLTRILAEHVWEHLTIEDGRTAARHCFEMLAPGGRARGLPTRHIALDTPPTTGAAESAPAGIA